MKPIHRFLTAAVVASVLAFAGCGGGKAPEAEKPRPEATVNFGGAPEELTITAPTMDLFLKVYVENQSKKNDGWLPVRDPRTGADRKMKVSKIVEGPLTSTGPGTWYRCLEMTDESGAVYDVDILSKKTARGIDVTDVLIHRDPEGERYRWVQENGVWVRKEG